MSLARNLGASAAASVLALTLGGLASPAEAGRLCNRADINSPCVSSSDLKANLVVGGNTGNGRLRLRNDDRDTGVELRATDGNVTNLFSNAEDESNGLVKAWAKINSDGTIAACWRCNTDPNETRRTATGLYEVDFTPLATDITGRPRSATVSGIGNVAQAVIRVVDIDADASAVNVSTSNATVPPPGNGVNAPFVVIIY
jgi:hypothetical protein